MKYFHSANPIIEFDVMCPREPCTHRVLVRAYCAPGKRPRPAGVECHKSYECSTCRICLGCILETFARDEEPDIFLTPFDPLLSPYWKE